MGTRGQPIWLGPFPEGSSTLLDTAIVESVQNYLRRLQENGLPVIFAVVFGSYATGTPTEWSDIDLLVVSSKFDESITRENVNHLWRVAARIDPQIEPVPCGERQWQEDTTRAIVEIARREGQRVATAA
ncbi:MAG: nucleotidyltransferase domain-containing protein [Candidatus Hydrogenedentes bacterium]|nr:nucleotidyltransferase domain-containing protein [Candidatus Hydrogenedentota bacterium]